MGNYIDINKCIERLDTVLDRIGYLSIDQARRINYNNALCDAAIKQIVRENKAFYSDNKKFLLRQPWRKPYGPIIGAVDVMLAFLTNIDVGNIFVKEFVPATERNDKEQTSTFNPKNDRLLLGFTRHGRMYEIYSASNKKELYNLYDYLKERHKNYLENCEEPMGIRYLIMVKTTSLFLYEAQDVDYLYAFAYASRENNETNVQFFNPQSVDNTDEFEPEEE